MQGRRGLVPAFIIAAALVCGIAQDAQAQSLGRLGRAVRAGVGAVTQEQDAKGGADAPVRGGARFTADQLDAFGAGLAVEAERRSAIAAELAALTVRSDYEQCKLQYSMSTDGARWLDAYSQAVMAYSADPQDARRQEAMQQAQRAFELALRGACGPSADEAEKLRRERQAEPARAGAERAGVDAAGYARLKELVLPFCAADGHEAGREARIPSGAGRHFTYSAEDTAVLAPRCARLLPLLQATL